MFAKKLCRVALLAVLALPFASPVAAQTVVLGGNPPGSLFNSMSNAIAAVVTKNSDLKVDMLPQGGSVYFPMMMTQEVDFGLVNALEAVAAYYGEPPYDRASGGVGFPLRTVMLGSPIRVSIVASKESGIKTGADLKGKRVVANYGAFASAGLTANAFLRNVGLTIDDVTVVTVSSYPEGVKAVIEGRADAAVGSVGSGVIQELEAARGAVFLSVDPSPEAMKRAREYGEAWATADLKPGLPGVEADTTTLSYAIPIVAPDTLSDAVVYEFTKALWDHYQELPGIFKPLSTWTSDRYASEEAIVPYHSGAIKFYKEKGVWTPALEVHQAALLSKKK